MDHMAGLGSTGIYPAPYEAILNHHGVDAGNGGGGAGGSGGSGAGGTSSSGSTGSTPPSSSNFFQVRSDRLTVV